MTPISVPLKSLDLSKLVQKWYAEFARIDDVHATFELVAAANYMEIGPLLDLIMFNVNLFIHGRSPGEICEIFNLPDKDAAIR